jgi:hypothetical protein
MEKTTGAACVGNSLSSEGAAGTTFAAGTLVIPADEGVCAFRFAEKMMAKNATTSSDLQNSFTSKLLITTPILC